MIYAYPIPEKQKSVLICEAFAAGCGGTVVTDGRYRTGESFFYGVNPTIESIWRRALTNHQQTFWYSDNSYFDEVRQKQFRVTKNMLQHSGIGRSNGQRFGDLGVQVHEWRERGAHIVLCEQSGEFMQIASYKGDWLAATIAALRQVTSRQVVTRRWARDKGWAQRPLDVDLHNAHALVTWSSAAAVTAVLRGVPAIVMGQCAAAPMCGSILDIENLPKHSLADRYNWAGVLADNQFTLDEMRSGAAWRMLNGG